MNPDLDRLQSYPFQKLTAPLHGITSNPDLAPISLYIGEPKHPTRMAGHVRFGARTGGALIILGVIIVVIALFFSGSVETIFKIFPAPKGSIVTQTSNDSAVVAALQGHAVEVSELARDGMVAMMRSARANMVGMMPRGPRAGTGQNTTPAPQAPASTDHVH